MPRHMGFRNKGLGLSGNRERVTKRLWAWRVYSSWIFEYPESVDIIRMIF